MGLTKTARQVNWFAPSACAREDVSLDGARHRNRAHLNTVVASPGAGSSWGVLAADYDDQATGWPEWSGSQAGYTDTVRGALGYLDWFGALPADPLVLEVGAGSGEASAVLAGRFGRLVVSDVSAKMLNQVTTPGVPRVVADVRRLPFDSQSVDLVVGLNAVPHAAEIGRVLKPNGCVAWCASFWRHTPLYVDPEALAGELGPRWRGVARRVGPGSWSVFHRQPRSV